MKKAEFLQVLSRRFMIAAVMVLGLMIGSSMSANAQQLGSADYYIAKLTDVKPQYESLQETFTPGSTKYNAVGELVDHIDSVISNLQEDSNYLAANDGFAVDRQRNPIWLKASPAILAEFSPAQLATMQANYQQLIQSGETMANPKVQKLNLVLDVNGLL